MFASTFEVLVLFLVDSTTTSGVLVPMSFTLLSPITLDLSSSCQWTVGVLGGDFLELHFLQHPYAVCSEIGWDGCGAI